MIEIFVNLERQFAGLGMQPPKVVIKHWQDWMRILAEVDAATRGYVNGGIGTNLVYCTIYGVHIEYGGEWPNPFDNSDVR